MAALRIDMTIPLGDAGHVRLTIDIASIADLAGDDRAFLAGTLSEFCAFAGRTLAPAPARADASATTLDTATVAEVKSELAAIYDPNGGVLAGVTGSRRNTS
jgi:hypothetical protein